MTLSSCLFDSPVLRRYSDIHKTISFEVGDVIVIKGEYWPLWFIWGHSVLVVSEEHIIQVNMIGERVHLMDLMDWLDMNSKYEMAVLRYRHMTPSLKKELQKESLNAIGRYYNPFQFKSFNYTYYCSSLIWSIYHEAGKKIGQSIDIDGTKGFLVLPADFVVSDSFEVL